MVQAPPQPDPVVAQRKRIANVSVAVLTFALPYLFIWQGLDFTDKGLMLAYADGMFRWPDVYGAFAGVWLSGALANVWMNVVPLPPVLGVNLLFAVLMSALTWVSFAALRKMFDATTVWPALLLGVLFLMPPLQNGYGYQALSVVLLSASALALTNGLVQMRVGWLIVAGIAAGFAVFARLPNVIALVLVFVPLAYSRIAHQPYNVKQPLMFLTGYVVGCVSMVLLLLSVGQWDDYVNGIAAMFAPITFDRYEYNTTAGLFNTHLTDARRMLYYSLFALAATLPLLGLVAYVITRQMPSPRLRQTAWLSLGLVAIGLSVVVLIYFPSGYVLKTVQRLVLCGVIGLTAVVLMLSSRTSIELRTLILSGLVATVACFAASDVGFGAYALYPVVVAVALWVFGHRSTVPLNFKVALRHVSLAFWLTVVVVVVIGLNLIYVYRDAPRSELTYAVRNEPKLNFILTNEPRRNTVEGLVQNLNRHVTQGATIWATPDLPMIYFLTSTRPFTLHPWDNLFNATAFERRLNNAEQNELPQAIVTAKGSARNSDWPTVIAQSAEPDRADKEKATTDFLSRNRYVMVWSDSFFEVWLPPQDR